MNEGTTTVRRRLRGASCLPAVLASLCVAAAAEATTLPPFQMLAVLDAPGGSLIARGDYAAAIARANTVRPRSGEDEFSRATNLCVAYTMTSNTAESNAACDRAIDLARTLDRDSAIHGSWGRRLARAHVNRAIAYWRAGDSAAAGQQLAAAQDISPNARYVRRNAAAFTARQQSLAKMTAE